MLPEEFVNLNVDSKLWPIITKPTRITKSTATLIDNIIVSDEIHKRYKCGIILNDISDHLPCYLVVENFHLKYNSPAVITSRKITPKNIERIKQNL